MVSRGIQRRDCAIQELEVLGVGSRRIDELEVRRYSE